ncbi:MAG: hypothetical protein XXXJIFNMEKO3_01442 [Candidatus Erwinia impunctatus]|nr:hypothetical protein XXXJIFNMEKO_01442 [Culicoides impunctatus]
MFNKGDIVQPKQGGPKMVVVDVVGETLYCQRLDDTADKKVEISSGLVNHYHEDGDFGVC